MGCHLVDAVVGESRSLDTESVVGLALKRIADERIDVMASELFLVACRELPEPVDIVGRARAGDIVGGQFGPIGGRAVSAYAHRPVVEIAVVVPLLSQSRRDLQIGQWFIDQVEVQVVARSLLRNIQFVGDDERIFGEIDAPVRHHPDHGATSVIAVLLIGRQVGQIHEHTLNNTVIDHTPFRLYHFVFDVVHRIAQAGRKVLGDLCIEIQTGINAIVIRGGDNTILIHVADAGHVANSLGTSRHRNVVAHHSGVAEHLVLPVGIVLLFDRRPGRKIVEHGVDTDIGERKSLGRTNRIVVVGTPRNAGGRRFPAIGIVARSNVQVPELVRIQQIDLTFELLNTIREIIADLGALALFAAFGCNQHDARSAARTVDCSRGGIFQNVDALDIARIDVNILRGRITVDNIQRIAASRERVDTPHTYLHALTRRAVGLPDLHAGDLAGKRLRHGGRRCRQFAGFDTRYRARKVAFAHGRIADNEHIRDLLAILFERNVEASGAADPNIRRGIPQIVDFQNGLRSGGGYLERKPAL